MRSVTPWYQAQLAIKGAWAAAIAALFLLVLAGLAVQTVRLEGLKVWPISITGWIQTAKAREGERDAERTAHAKTKADYRDAQVEAERQETARIERVRTQQKEITDAIESDYLARVADLGARADRLRAQLRPRTDIVGAPPGEQSAPLRDSAGRTDEAAGDSRLPAGRGEPVASQFGRTPEEQLERDIVATQQALQLDALIDWIRRQTAIDPNKSEEIHQ